MNAAWNPEESPTNSKFDLFHQLADSTTLTDLSVRRAHLLSRQVRDLTLQKMSLVIFSCLDTTLFNLHAYETSFDGCDFACSRFEGGFFQKVTFNDCTFRQVAFVNCVFDDCSFASKEGIAFERCVFLERQAENIPVVTPVAISKSVVATPAVTTTPTETPKAEGRFSHLEK